MGIKGEDSHWKIETVKILIQQVGTFHSIFKTWVSTSPSLNNTTMAHNDGCVPWAYRFAPSLGAF